jgi:hypothetical protein
MISLNPYEIDVGSPEWLGISRTNAAIGRLACLLDMLKTAPTAAKGSVALAIDVDRQVLDREIGALVEHFFHGRDYINPTHP